MARTFNITGPCDPARHYMIPAERRLPDLGPFLEQQLYFVLHAARQTGKTTAMLTMAARLRETGTVALWATLETCQAVEEVERAEPLWIAAIQDSATLDLPAELRPPSCDLGEPGQRFRAFLRAWSAAVPERPIVLLLDEADVVSGPALISLLRQLRAGFTVRGPGRFPTSIGLIGMRDLRDWLTRAKDGVPVNPGSPFNIKAASLTLRNFTEGEVAELYAQHTADTGQVFLPEAVARAFWWSQGQPFLVNALARIAVTELGAGPVQASTIDEAKERLVLARTTHLDALAERLKEPRVARTVQAVLLGDAPSSIAYDHDDFTYAVDLGLIRRGRDGAEPANPLYREVLGRQLSYNVQEAVPRPRWRWATPDGRLDMPALVDAFFDWWRDNSEIVAEHTAEGYREAVPHLAFMGFLQRVVNGGGEVLREFAAGRGAVDLVVRYGGERHVIELKRVPPTRRTLERIREDGVVQLGEYLDTLGAPEGWLLVFDQRAGRSWEERLWREERTVDGRVLHLRGG